jgi:predicted RNA binding protein YcfA (HicA-like mRNA interferase family)
MAWTWKDAVREAKKLGWFEDRHTGHKIMKHKDWPEALLVIPVHPGDLSPLVERNIKKTLGLK